MSRILTFLIALLVGCSTTTAPSGAAAYVIEGVPLTFTRQQVETKRGEPDKRFATNDLETLQYESVVGEAYITEFSFNKSNGKLREASGKTLEFGDTLIQSGDLKEKVLDALGKPTTESSYAESGESQLLTELTYSVRGGPELLVILRGDKVLSFHIKL